MVRPLRPTSLTAERLTAGLDVDHAQRVRQQIVDEVLASSARLTEKSPGQAPVAGAVKPEKKPKSKKPKPKKRIPNQAQASVNGQSPN